MKIIKNLDKWLLFVTILLFAIGSIMIFSASNVSAYIRYATSPYKYLGRQILILLFGFIVSVAIFLFNVKFITRVSTWVTYILFISLPLLFVFGVVTNDAQSWFKLIGEFNMQPSEFLKIFVIIWLARYYYVNKDKLGSYVKSLYPLALCVVAFFLIAFQPDLGTAILFLLIFGAVFFMSPTSWKIKGPVLGIGVGVVLIAILTIFTAGSNILSERQMSRIKTVLKNEPCSEQNYYTDGNQVCNGYIAINNGGLKGRGLGRSIQKYLYLPESHTDFIFCIIIEELGLIFGLFILFLYIILLSRIIIIGKRSLNNRDALICYGGAFYIFIHIIINLAGIFGLIPMTGVPLPFMSYGGSYTLCLLIILTIIQRINVETRIINEERVGKNKK